MIVKVLNCSEVSSGPCIILSLVFMQCDKTENFD